MNAADILARLQSKYCPPEWQSFAEMCVATGYTRGEQRLDFWTLSTYPGRNHTRLGFEIKVSRSDFAAELRKPAKRRPALLLVNRFYFIAPVGVVPIEKLPIDAGLIEVLESGIMKTRCEAPWLDTEPPTWGFLASFLRRIKTAEAEKDE